MTGSSARASMASRIVAVVLKSTDKAELMHSFFNIVYTSIPNFVRKGQAFVPDLIIKEPRSVPFIVLFP